MTEAIVGIVLAAAGTWLMLWAIRDIARIRRPPQLWEGGLRQRQLDRVVRENEVKVRWRR